MLITGSTGSRIHIHSYTYNDGDPLPIIEPSLQLKVTPGMYSVYICIQSSCTPLAGTTYDV